MTDITNPVARRAFITGLGVGAAALGAGLATGAAADEAAAPASWKPTYDPQDDWMELPGKHRLLFDSISPDGAVNALGFVSNYIATNKSGYEYEHTDLANIVVMRHFATPFGYTDAMWAKYGAVWGKLLKHKDPKTKGIALRNTLNTANSTQPSPDDSTIPMLVPNAHVVASGIVAVNRAQERGYAFSYVG